MDELLGCWQAHYGESNFRLLVCSRVSVKHRTGLITVPRFDPAGFIMEHYVDGDLLDMREPTHRTKASPDNLHVWGE